MVVGGCVFSVSPVVVGVESGEGHVVEDAEAVGDGPHAVQLDPGVVPRRPDRTEGVVRFSVEHPVHRLQHRACEGG